MRTLIYFSFAVATFLLCGGCQHYAAGVAGRVPTLDGLTEQQLVAKMGEPFRREQFTASASRGKFYPGLERMAERLQSEDVPIRELTWERGDYLISTWLCETNGSWITFDSLKYGKNVKL